MNEMLTQDVWQFLQPLLNRGSGLYFPILVKMGMSFGTTTSSFGLVFAIILRIYSSAILIA